jgi:pimeloyl-ACP methyl ester carboxylesterase
VVRERSYRKRHHVSNRLGGAFMFGAEQNLFGAISDPKGQASSVGAIIWGVGAGELRVARALARLGIVAMLIRQSKGQFERLDTEGVRYCKEAIDALRSRRAVDRFILVGNCSRASISLRTTLDDPRVVGLVLSNPAMDPVFTTLQSYRQKLLSAASWQRLLAGRANPLFHLRSAKRIKTLLFGRLVRSNEKELIAQSGAQFKGDLMMPDNVGPRLEALAGRGVRILLVFSESDIALGYFRRLYGRSFARLNAIPGMSAEVLSTPAHIFTLDDAAAGPFSDTICRWAGRERFADRRVPQVIEPSPPSAALC